MKKPKVSVLTPICNVERFLDECLASLAAQTLQDIEFICLNDGSTDNSLAILESYAAQDDRFIVVDKPNSGYGHTMNVGLSMARGEYVGIVESDDYVEPNAFEELYSAAIEYQCDIVKANRFSLSEAGSERVEILRGLPYRKVFSPVFELQNIFNPAPTIWTAIYSRDMLEKNKISFVESPGASFQDTGFVYKSYIAANRMLLLEDAFLHYRIDNEGSSVKSSSKVYCVMDEFASIDAFLENYPEKEVRLRGKYNELRYRTYAWNATRLDEESRREFMAAVAEEFRQRRAMGRLSSDGFSESAWHEVLELIGENSSKEKSAVKASSAPSGVKPLLKKVKRKIKAVGKKLKS